MAEKNIWIEAEEWDEGLWNPEDAVTDVVVTLEDGSRWVAAFCTFRHLETLRSSCRESGDCLGGKYLWASDLVLVDDTARPTIEAVVADLIANEDLPNAFSEIDEEGEECDDPDHDHHQH